MKEYLSDASVVLAERRSSGQGLTEGEAAKRLQENGPNRLKEGKKVSLLERFIKELADPMTLILVAAAIISGITAAYAGESFADVIIIMAVVVINAVLGVFQESKAEKALEDTLTKLRDTVGGDARPLAEQALRQLQDLKG